MAVRFCRCPTMTRYLYAISTPINGCSTNWANPVSKAWFCLPVRLTSSVSFSKHLLEIPKIKLIIVDVDVHPAACLPAGRDSTARLASQVSQHYSGKLWLLATLAWRQNPWPLSSPNTHSLKIAEAIFNECAPGGIRTHGLQFRKLTLYPAKLRVLQNKFAY